MNKIYKILIFVGIMNLISCAGITDRIGTRVETDVFTITDIDTVYKSYVKNSPVNKDGGVVFPSSKTLIHERTLLQKDSVVERYYPNFIRLGVFEGIGISGGDPNFGFNPGPFGIFINPLTLDENSTVDEEQGFFTGGIYRLGIGEWRLNIFGDDPNWVFGINALEVIRPDREHKNFIMGIAAPYIKKRWFLWEDIPYFNFAAQVGGQVFPANYVNASVSAEFGSIGGLNARLYLGYFVGETTEKTINTQKSGFYVGLGASFLDFHNKPEELEIEWKDHPHSAYEIGVLELSGFWTNAKYGFNADLDGNQPGSGILKGFGIKLLNADLALPFWNNRFYVGTSLLNLQVMGYNEETEFVDFGIAMMPLRFGYKMEIPATSVVLDPFVEYGFYPSTMLNIGLRAKFQTTDSYTFAIVMGYSKANPVGGAGSGQLLEEIGELSTYDRLYFGVQLGIFERLFSKEKLRYEK